MKLFHLSSALAHTPVERHVLAIGMPKVKIVSAAAIALAATGWFYGAASQFPWGWARDDGYFYSKIAYNIAIHGVSSFD